MKILANSSCDYQIMDRSRHTVTKYLSGEKTHAANNSKLFKKLEHMNNSLYEVELTKAQIEHRKPIIVGFFLLQYAKLRMSELYYNFFTRFCDVNKFEVLEMDTDSLHLALAEKEADDCMRPEMRAEWRRLRSNDCVIIFTADALASFFPEHVVYNTNNMIGQSLAPSKKSSDVRSCYVCAVRLTVAMTSPLISFSSAVKVSANVNWNRVATDHWKSIAESWRKSKPRSEKQRFPNKQSLCCYLWASYEKLVLLLPKESCREWWNSHSTA